MGIKKYSDISLENSNEYYYKNDIKISKKEKN